MLVTPYVGVWIEIYLKEEIEEAQEVTPYVGVWIEMLNSHFLHQSITVTPYVGVWIEISILVLPCPTIALSLPTWECGLK